MKTTAENREEILKREAEFHDHQMFESDRKREGEFYAAPDYKRVEKKQIDLVGDIRNKKVLDYGSGPGQWTRRWLKKGAEVTAIDISPESIKTLQKRMKPHS